MAGAILASLLLLQAQPLSAAERFFVGRFEGSGTVHIIFSGRQNVRDVGRGRMEGNVLVIDQMVYQEGAEPRRRHWRLTRVGPDRFTGTITDVRGAVSGRISGNVLSLSYRSAQGPWVEQTITLHANGRTADNRMTFRRFGVRVATLESTIRRLD